MPDVVGGEVRVHRRQFVIGPEPIRARRDWQARPLGPGLVLSYCPSLPLEQTDDGLILGIALRPSEVRSAWAGRWAFVADDGRLELDASGLLGIFSREISSSVWASSSPSILRELEPRLAGPSPPLDPDDWTRDWYPPPRSGFAGVSRLLASQTLDLTSGDIEARRLLPAPVSRPPDGVLDDLAHILVALVALAAERFPDLWVSLSGGIDSRLVLAATHGAGVPVTVYTNDKPGVITKADRTLPPRLAHALGLEHRLVRPRPPDSRRLALFDMHTAEHTFDTDRRYVACGQWDQIPTSALVLGGNTWEVGRCAHHAEFAESFPAEDSETGKWLAEWITWAKATPDESLDWRDRYHIEQKLTGWLSSIEQAIDITGRQRVHIANCADVFSLLLSLPEEMRRTGEHQRTLVRMLAPKLDRFPVNAPETLVARAARRLGTRSPAPGGRR
jgi:hypothetical protein